MNMMNRQENQPIEKQNESNGEKPNHHLTIQLYNFAVKSSWCNLLSKYGNHYV
jgi:hypothetical protein